MVVVVVLESAKLKLKTKLNNNWTISTYILIYFKNIDDNIHLIIVNVCLGKEEDESNMCVKGF